MYLFKYVGCVLSRIIRKNAIYIFVIAIAFILFQTFILLNSFPAIHRMFTLLPERIEVRGSFWTLFWFTSEFVGEIGLIIRYVGACLFFIFSCNLLRKNQFSFSIIKKVILLEGIYFLFYIPFIVNLFTRPANIYSAEAIIVYQLTAISYTIQTVLIFVSFILLYKKLNKNKIEKEISLKYGAIAIISYVFALWIKHFLFNLYALPIDVSNVGLIAGLVNSGLTILIAAILLLFAFRPIIRGQTKRFNTKLVGFAFLLIGLYFVIYILVALVNSSYMAFLSLTELWVISFLVLGSGLLKDAHNAFIH